MTEASEQPELRRNDAQSRYEVWYDGTLAGFAEYQENENETTFTHTEVDSAFEGKGLGSRLARFGIEDALGRSRRIRPECPFIRSYLERHPQYSEHVIDITSNE